MLKTIKIPTVAPTCFGSRRNRHQGAISCLAKSTIMILLCSSLMKWSMSWRHTSLLCKRAVCALKPNDAYICRTAPLTSRCCILYIYSTHISTAYFKHAANSPFFPLQNDVYFIILHCLVPVLFAFYIQSVLKFKCKIQAPKG